MSTLSDIQTYINAAVAFRASGDLASAISNYEAALMLINGIPDTMTEGDSTRWDRAAIQNTINSLRRQQSASVGIQRTNIVIRRPCRQ